MEDAELARREVLLESPKRFVRDELVMPDGERVDWFYVDTPPSALVIPVTAAGNLVMVRQYRYNLREHVTEFPAGIIADGEKPADAAARELAEETGYALEPGAVLEPLGAWYSLPSETTKRTHVFLARPVRRVGTPVLDTEIERYFDMSVEEIPVGEAQAALGTRITGFETLAALLMAREALHRP
jgi:ADP-ribose pyrophosphatase